MSEASEILMMMMMMKKKRAVVLSLGCGKTSSVIAYYFLIKVVLSNFVCVEMLRRPLSQTRKKCVLRAWDAQL